MCYNLEPVCSTFRARLFNIWSQFVHNLEPICSKFGDGLFKIWSRIVQNLGKFVQNAWWARLGVWRLCGCWRAWVSGAGAPFRLSGWCWRAWVSGAGAPLRVLTRLCGSWNAWAWASLLIGTGSAGSTCGTYRMPEGLPVSTRSEARLHSFFQDLSRNFGEQVQAPGSCDFSGVFLQASRL